MPDEIVWQSKPQLAAAMVRALHHAGVLPFKSMVADGLYPPFRTEHLIWMYF
jgi:SRSO17 transposase